MTAEKKIPNILPLSKDSKRTKKKNSGDCYSRFSLKGRHIIVFLRFKVIIIIIGSDGTSLHVERRGHPSCT